MKRLAVQKQSLERLKYAESYLMLSITKASNEISYNNGVIANAFHSSNCNLNFSVSHEYLVQNNFPGNSEDMKGEIMDPIQRGNFLVVVNSHTHTHTLQPKGKKVSLWCNLR